MINWNIEPYNDDFSEENKFLKILFRPGKAVQTRELNQLQTILQNQISRQADNLFKQGAMIIPGQISMDSSVHYVKLMDTNIYGTSVNSIIDSLIGQNLVNQNGVVAKVIFATKRTSTEQATLFVKYINSGGTDTKTFSKSDKLDVKDPTTAQFDLSVDVYDADDSIGIGTLSSIERGVYYINGMFCIVEPQTIVLEKYSSQPSYRVGLNVVESIVTPENDQSLLDNSQGTPNFAAPGAHRYKIDLVLSKRDLTTPDDKDFIELMRVDAGVIQKQVRATEYSILEQTLARRTFDESGDYTVRDFSIELREDRNNNRGEWKASTAYKFGDIVTHNSNTYVCRTINGTSSGTNPPTHTSGIVSDGTLNWKYETNPAYNHGVYQDGDASKLCVALGPSKAYVRGFEIEKIATEYVKVNKARTSASVEGAIVAANVGNYITVTNISGGVPNIDSFIVLNLSDNTSTIGTCRLRGIERNSDVSHKLFIFDVNMNSGKYIENVKRVSDPISGFTCDVYGSKLNVYEPQNATLVYQLPFSAIKNVVAERTQYAVSRTLSINTLNYNSSTQKYDGSCVISDGEFASEEGYANYTVFCTTQAHGTKIIYPTITRSSDKKTITLSNMGSDVTTPITVVATVLKSGAQRNKVLNTTSIAITDASRLTPSSGHPLIIALGKTDGYKLNSVKMDVNGFSSNPSYVPSYTLDITDRFTFDNGQRETHYDVANLVLKGSYLPPNGPIKVDFDYFDHTSGDYFSVNSYINMAYEEVPNTLRDSIDFRPTISLDGTFATSSNYIPKRGFDVTMDFDYYLPRKSKISLDYTGKFFVTDGESSLNPGEPADVPLSMILYNLTLEAYTFGTSNTNVKVNKVDNKRYTMRDIGKLEKRIDNLEYYASLSLLEQETSNMSIVDNTGLDRFKNGFIVDNFTGHGIGDVGNQDYMCSIDMEKGELRPFFSMNNINMMESASIDSERTSGDNYYACYGDVVTLPIVDHVGAIEQPYGSRVESVNPFSVTTFLGDMKLNPSSDEWFKTDRRPDVINNTDGNYNSLLSMQEDSGVLGSIWNSWQNVWAGISTNIPLSSLANRNITYNPQQISTLETVATDIGLARGGIKTTVVSKTDVQTINDRVVTTSVIPYLRSRAVVVQVKGLKPFTRFYAFFDDIEVTQYCQAASYLKYVPTGVGLSFDSSTSAGANSKESARMVNGNTEVAYNIGDVVSNFTGTDTAVVIGSHVTGSNYYLHVVNVKGSFIPNQAISGSLSKATAKTVASDSTNSTALVSNPSLVSNINGDLNLVFFIPDESSIRFRTGVKEFKLIDSKDSASYSSKASAHYVAQGAIETKMASINAVRNASVVRESLTDTSTLIESVDRPIGNTNWYNPLAQSFSIQNRGGAFLSKVDLFFAAKDDSLPITIEIREMVNGYPGNKVLPFSRVTLNSDQVNISTQNVNLNSVLTPSYDKATTFKFASPVYVSDSQEYCLVIISDSTKYKVWIAQMGDNIPNSQRTISEQPYSGLLFKPQNTTSWTSNQYQDLKFKFYRAKFDVQKVGRVSFVNDVIPTQSLEMNPFQFKSGSSKVIVYQRDHGFKAGDSVTISGAIGLNASMLNGTHVIPTGNIQIDSYMIDLGSSNVSTMSGYFGGGSVKATRNYTYNTVYPVVQVQNFPETLTTYTMNTTDYLTGYADTSSIPVLANENNTLLVSPKVVKSGSVSSCKLTCFMQSDNDSLSPVIDTHRTSLVLVSNKVDAPTAANTNYDGFDPIYVSDTSAVGASNYSNYITRKIKFVNPSTLIKVKLAANIPAQSSIELYYRVSPSGSNVNLSTVEWTKIEAEGVVANVENGNDTFTDISYMKSVSSFDAIQIKLALKSVNTSAVPRVKDLRIIACA